MKRKNLILIALIIIIIAGIFIVRHKIRTARTAEKFSISQFGFWSGKKTADHHIYMPILANNLLKFFKENDVKSVIDLGAGLGNYTQFFISNGIFTSCYDGNPNTQKLSNGTCAVINLAEPIHFANYDWVLSLEVGEHVPKEFEDTLISNLDRLNNSGIILSWAIPGQGGDGHINEQTNEDIKKKFADLGYTNDVEAEKKLRDGDVLWFKNTMMVFRKNKTKLADSINTSKPL